MSTDSASAAGSAATQLASDVANQSLEHPAKTSQAADELSKGVSGEDHEEEGEEDGDEQDDGDAGGAQASSAAKKKKKKSNKKKKKKPAAEEGSDGVASVHPGQAPDAIPSQDIPSLLQQLALSQADKKEGKAPEEYKFWNTQPVRKLGEAPGAKDAGQPDGPILSDEKCKAAVKAEPEKLLDGFEWCVIDIDDKEELQEFYDLLYNHYVEDLEGAFRFNYSAEFLNWALKPPGWKKEWHIGVRTKPSEAGKKGKLVASIAGIPVTLRVRNKTFGASEINFLAIHRKLRNKRLAPLLIKEVTRQCNLQGIYQALYTAGTVLPTPISTCRYFHRSLDWEHLYRTGFSHLPHGSSELRQKYRYKLESHTQIKGLRPMKPADIPAVRDLLTRYLERCSLRPEFSEEEIEHWLCSDTSKGVVTSIVVEENGKITDFISYYLLNSTVLRSSKQETIRAAYLYYYATETAFPPGGKAKAKDVDTAIQARLQLLVHDALILAKKDNVHVFNALTMFDNPLFLKEQKFEPGDGKLHYYLFNWRTPPINGGINEHNQIDTSKMGGIGLVML